MEISSNKGPGLVQKGDEYKNANVCSRGGRRGVSRGATKGKCSCRKNLLKNH
jgi:hypothetical protein